MTDCVRYSTVWTSTSITPTITVGGVETAVTTPTLATVTSLYGTVSTATYTGDTYTSTATLTIDFLQTTLTTTLSPYVMTYSYITSVGQCTPGSNTTNTTPTSPTTTGTVSNTPVPPTSSTGNASKITRTPAAMSLFMSLMIGLLVARLV
ncbi:hypothetical protein CPB86DRAFT_781876, partial [Serendipita vermifera]